MSRTSYILIGLVLLVSIISAFIRMTVVHPPAPPEVRVGGFTYDAGECFYRVVDGELSLVVLIDGHWAAKDPRRVLKAQGRVANGKRTRTASTTHLWPYRQVV